MTAKQALEQWVKEHRKLETADEKRHFYQTLTSKLNTQSNEDRLEGLIALKEAVSNQHSNLLGESNQKAISGFQVYPASEEDQAFLQALFFRMNIPFKMTA